MLDRKVGGDRTQTETAIAAHCRRSASTRSSRVRWRSPNSTARQPRVRGICRIPRIHRIRQAALVGAASELEVSTRSGGEGAHAWSDELTGESVAQRLSAHPDVTAVLVRCDLCCEDRHGGTFVIPGGMTFWVQLADLASPAEEALEMNITLDTDVYLATTWGDERDNRELAMRNAPRFNRLLAELLRDTDATVESVSADDYRGQVDASGIVLPAVEDRE